MTRPLFTRDDYIIATLIAVPAAGVIYLLVVLAAIVWGAQP